MPYTECPSAACKERRLRFLADEVKELRSQLHANHDEICQRYDEGCRQMDEATRKEAVLDAVFTPLEPRTINQLSKFLALIVGIVLLMATNRCDAQTLFALPAPPASLAPVSNPNLGSLPIGWTRSPSTNVVSYSVQYGTNPGALNNSAGVGDVTNATITGLAPANTYFLTVTARNESGVDSDPANMVTNFVQPKMLMLPDRWRVWLSLPMGRTNIVQSCTNAAFIGVVRNILTNTIGGSVWFYATNDAMQNFYRVKP